MCANLNSAMPHWKNRWPACIPIRPTTPRRQSPGEDWEATKRRLLAELDSDQPTAKQMTQEDRLTAEGAIRITDSIVSQRDAEIADLKHQLAQLQMNQSNPIYNPQSAADEVLEQDELVRQERERLESLENEMKEKVAHGRSRIFRATRDNRTAAK